MLHLILYMGSEEKINKKLEELGYPNFPMVSECFVSCKKTAQELAKEVGIGEDGQTGFVAEVENYQGFVGQLLIKWLNVHGTD